MAQANQPAETPPTIADVQAIGTAAAGAAQTESQQGASPEAAGQAAAQAAQAEAEARNIQLPPEVIEQIAKASAAATVSELASQGALEARPPETAEAEETETAETEQQAAQPAAKADEPPHKPTLAERLLDPYHKR